jgi:hypothetical protein
MILLCFSLKNELLCICLKKKADALFHQKNHGLPGDCRLCAMQRNRVRKISFHE